MSTPRPLSGASAELVLATLFLDTSAERSAALRAVARDVPAEEWFDVTTALELHGVLPLAWRNLELASVELPASAAEALRARDAALREDSRSDALTLGRLLETTRRADIELVLLKGASLATDLYEDPSLRSQGDIDVLVEPRQVRSAVRAAATIGLLPTERQVPLWWYRLAHFHVKLSAETRFLRDVEIHWRLHSPALLLTVTTDQLRGRLQPVEVGGVRAWAQTIGFVRQAEHGPQRVELQARGSKRLLRLQPVLPGGPLLLLRALLASVHLL